MKSMSEFVKVSNIFVSKVDISSFMHATAKEIKIPVSVKYRTPVAAVALNLLNCTANSAIVQNARD